MIREETRRKLRDLNLEELIQYLEMDHIETQSHDLSFDERFQMMIDYLYQEKYTDKVHRLLKNARLRLPKAEINDIYYADRGISKTMILELGTCQFMDRNMNIVFQGYTGSGKTYLACAVAKQACKLQYRTKYIRIPDLLMEYDESTLLKNGPQKILRKYSTYPLLILDEWLLEEISENEQFFLFELIERRHDTASTIFCTQFKKENWHKRLGGGAHADAMMDRIIYNSIFVETGTFNMREYFSAKREYLNMDSK